MLAYTFLRGSEVADAVSWRELQARAWAVASALRKNATPGDVPFSSTRQVSIFSRRFSEASVPVLSRCRSTRPATNDRPTDWEPSPPTAAASLPPHHDSRGPRHSRCPIGSPLGGPNPTGYGPSPAPHPRDGG